MFHGSSFAGGEESGDSIWCLLFAFVEISAYGNLLNPTFAHLDQGIEC